MNKICKQCGFEGEKSQFKGNSCKLCYNESERQKRYIELGLVIPPKIKSLKKCKTKDCANLTSKHRTICSDCLNAIKRDKWKTKDIKSPDLHKVCNKCNLEKKYSEFYVRQNICKMCQKKYAEKNKKKITEYLKTYRENNKSKRNIGEKTRKKNDPIYRLRTLFSTIVCRALKKENNSKNGYSVLKFLPYSIQKLKDYLQLQFEPWMNWNNQGKYNVKNWDDNDPTTWTWQIDHIIPQSELIYVNMEDNNFKKCWALENLRPLSAKLNLLKGNKVGII